MNSKGMFYTNVSDYETKEDMMNDFIALRMYDMAKDKEIERLNNIINELEKWLDKKEKLTFNSWNKGIHEIQRKLQKLKGSDKE